MNSWPWSKKARKTIPKALICWLSGLARPQKSANQNQRYRFNIILALALEVDTIIPRSPDLLIFWPCSQQSTKSVPELQIWWLSGIGPRSREKKFLKSRFNDFLAVVATEIEKTNIRSPDLMTFQPWLKKWTKPVPEGSIWWHSSLDSRSRENQSQEARFDDFLALAPKVDKTSPGLLDLMTFWPWFHKSAN